MHKASDWAVWQHRENRADTKRFPWLREVKRERMLASPHAFLRGSAPLFYRLIGELALGDLLHARAWIVGDMHIENVGAYRTDDDTVVFDLNDFDASGEGPVVFDVLRLLTSILLTGRAFALDGTRALQLAQSALHSWQEAAVTGRVAKVTPSIQAMTEEARNVQLRTYLDRRAPMQAGKRRFVRGSRYHSLVPPWGARSRAMLAAYVSALGDRAPKRGYKQEDAAHRIAGTGSLGVTRVAYVVTSAEDTYRLIELKEAQRLPPGIVGPKNDATRIVAAARALVEAPPRGLAALKGMPFVGRRLEPQQQKLNILALPTGELDATFVHIASLLGRAHRRSATEQLKRLSEGQKRRVVQHAATLAGMHEAIYLAFCCDGLVNETQR